MTGRMQAKWTNRILDEMQRNLAANRPDIPAEKLGKLRLLMNTAVRDCLVEGYEPLIEGLKLRTPMIVMCWLRRSRRARKSSSHRTSRASPLSAWLPGMSR
ncbi:hypothetical protein GCM10009850_081610 [Nonomuraea monospora]|uniref:Uncharacterized protein n=1 Tax=Nonomuraea monospora TaxID=568818 RepID=A0ABN3CTU8_9ACTN